MKVLIVATAAALLLSAAPASAAVTISSEGNEIRAVGAPGEASDVGVTSMPDHILFIGRQASDIAPGKDCEAPATGGVRCDRKGAKRITVELGDGDDALGVALSGNDELPLTYSGGEGNDSVTLGGTVTLDGRANDGPLGHDDIRPDVENLKGTVGADSLTGSDAANALAGNAGTDTLSGAGGDDFIDGLDFVDCESEGECERPDLDTISCGDGFDTVDADRSDGVATDCELVARANVITGTFGDDTIDAWRPALQIYSRAGEDRLTGPGGNTLNAGSGNDYVRGFRGTGSSLTGGSGNDRVISGRGHDGLSGGYGRDRLYGYNGKDEISGGAGRDTIYAGDGNDRVTSRERGNERDVVNCGKGRDVVVADRRDRIARNCERVILAS